MTDIEEALATLLEDLREAHKYYCESACSKFSDGMGMIYDHTPRCGRMKAQYGCEPQKAASEKRT